jgi:hypothetical protein
MPVGHFYFLLGLGALALLAFLLSLVRRFGRRHRLPYVADQILFSPAQQAFLPVLERAMGRGYRVYGKVRVADVLGVRPRIGAQARRRAFERLGQRRFDFIVCTAETSAIACAVSLSPRSRLGRRPSRDGLDRICAAARLPFVRFREGDSYSVVEIEERVFGAMHALRLMAKEPEPSGEETREALAHLSASISSGQQDPDRRGKPRLGARFVPAGKPSARSAASESARTDPVLAPVMSAGAEVDEGPRFRIDGDLDLEDRPVRLGKT